MRGRPGCPTGQEKKSVGATVSNPLFYKERLGTKSPPHPTRLRRPTFPPRGRLWVEKNLASQTSGPRKGRNKIQFVFCTDMCRAKNSSHPESASFAGAVRGASPNFGIPAQRVPKFLPLPARPAGGRAVTDVGLWAAGQAKKKEDPRRVPPTRKGGSREEEPLPPWCSFLRLSSKESRAPPPELAGEEYLLFLNQPSMGGAFHTLGDYYYITGVTQGVFQEGTAGLYTSQSGDTLSPIQLAMTRSVPPVDSDSLREAFVENQQANLANGFITQEEYDAAIAGMNTYATVVD